MLLAFHLDQLPILPSLFCMLAVPLSAVFACVPFLGLFTSTDDLLSVLFAPNPIAFLGMHPGMI